MRHSSSNDRSNVLVHCAWALVAAAAFGVGYVVSTPPMEEAPAAQTARKLAPIAIDKGDERESPVRAEPSSGLAQTKTVDQSRSGNQDLDRPVAPKVLDLPPGKLVEPEVAEDLSPASPVTQAYPAHGSPLSREDAHKLLTGTVIFNPGAIPSSNAPVQPTTHLYVGQDLQVKYGSTWWAGTVLGFEPDGRVKIRYFGWANSYDEPKTREELQLDRDARVRALDKTYVRQGW